MFNDNLGLIDTLLYNKLFICKYLPLAIFILRFDYP